MSEDTIQKMRSIEHAIHQVEVVKRQLNRNTPEVKNNITTSVSRHLEALRNREVWLLNQVDLIKGSKEEVLHNQLTRLHKELGALQCLLNTSEGEEVTQDPNIIIDLSDLKPEETPYIAFKADSVSLREAVMNYGRVDPNGLPVSGQFQDPRKPSACLPPQFEDYDDAEHHVLYKTVEEIKQAKTRNQTIEVNIPRLSSNPKDWLCRSSTITTSSASEPKFSFPAFSKSTTEWLKQPVTTEVSDSGRRPIMSLLSSVQTSSSKSSASFSKISCELGPPGLSEPMTSNASITTWLQQIRNKDIEDEEDFEVVDHSSVGTADSIHTFATNSEPVRLSSQSSALKWPSFGSSSLWLQPTAGEGKSAVSTKQNNVFDSYFAQRDSKDSTWLCKDKKASCCESGCSKPSFSFEIENLGNCLSDKLWLKSENTNDTLKWLCKANEPCKSFSECLGKPSCLQEHKNSVESTHTEDLPGMRIFTHSASDSRNWLLNGGKNVESTTKCPGFEHFEELKKRKTGWLKSEQDCSKSMEPNITFEDYRAKPLEADQQMWLQPNSNNHNSNVESLSSDTWQNVVNQHNQIADDQWLLTAVTSPKKQKVMQELDNEEWLLKKEEMECETSTKVDAIKFPVFDDDNTQWLLQ